MSETKLQLSYKLATDANYFVYLTLNFRFVRKSASIKNYGSVISTHSYRSFYLLISIQERKVQCEIVYKIVCTLKKLRSSMRTSFRKIFLVMSPHHQSCFSFRSILRLHIQEKMIEMSKREFY